MKIETVKSLFQLAGFEILDLYELMNQYWPKNETRYYELIIENSWWLIITKYGLIKIGPRKRVISIDWSKTCLTKIITTDETTKNLTLVHAWTIEKALEYLKTLNQELILAWTPCPDRKL